MLEWMLVATGFTGAMTLVFLARGAARKFHLIPTMSAHFSPKGGCTETVVREIGRARREILVQAYSFSCPSIAEALVAARKRGVTVHILLDRSNEKETYSELGSLEQHGMAVKIDATHAIAHNKIMLIDRKTIITGSFNFTRQAEQDNAENLLVIKGHPELAESYHLNFLAHDQHSQAPGAAAAPHAGHAPVAHDHGHGHAKAA
jgi:phosphatidylserine/phosphatidylglycerophosphate/cardiolipin synthase-like enzyme